MIKKKVSTPVVEKPLVTPVKQTAAVIADVPVVPSQRPVLSMPITEIYKKPDVPVPKVEKSIASTTNTKSLTTSQPSESVDDMETENSSSSKKKGKSKMSKKSRYVRMAGGQTWEDESLAEWETDDFRLFCGDLGNEVNDDVLTRAFNKYPSFQKAKVIRDKRTGKTKGYGFVSFKDSHDFIKAMREMNGKYVGNRPIKLRKSQWKDRNMDNVKKKVKEKVKIGFKITS